MPPSIAEDAQRGHHVHRRVDVVEVPLVGRQRAVRVLEPLAQQHEQLVLRERRIEVRPRDAWKPEVPGREPRVLPRVRHREHVERVEVPPVAVAARAGAPRAAAARRGRRRASGARCTGTSACSRRGRRRPGGGSASCSADVPVGRERRVELVGVGLARGDDLVERVAGPGPLGGVLRLRRGLVEPQPQLGLAAGRHRHAVAQRRLRADAVRVDRVRRPRRRGR